MTLRFQVSDMLGEAQTRSETASVPMLIEITSARVDGEVSVELVLSSLSDGIIARGVARADAVLTCNRCLTEWPQARQTHFEQVFRKKPEDEDDELPIDSKGWIDLEAAVHDEVVLDLPIAPLCRPDCLGLCPTCGTDLNTDPCDGHGDVTDSPFATLKQLFEP